MFHSLFQDRPELGDDANIRQPFLHHDGGQIVAPVLAQ
jgi:hypothetical protein